MLQLNHQDSDCLRLSLNPKLDLDDPRGPTSSKIRAQRESHFWPSITNHSMRSV